MRPTLLLLALAVTGWATGADAPGYGFDALINLDDARVVRLRANVPDGTKHTLQIDGTRHVELRTFRHPPEENGWHETRATIMDTAGGAPRVLRELVRNSNGGETLAGALSLCGTRVIFVNQPDAAPGRCADLLPLAAPDRTVAGCGDCDGAYEGLPAAVALTNSARIAPVSEPGEPLRVTGRVLGPDGKPRGGVIVYAYHTDRFGIYPPPAPARAESHHQGTLRGWVRTNDDGRYRFDTIRPASYPQTTNPQHIHMHVIEPGCFTYFIDEMLFTDDPMFRRLGERDRAALMPGMGGSGLVTPRPRGKVAEVVRDIHLGRNIQGYPGCS